ncbi:MAG TPA: VWA domain-containing protein, partial [Bryobacterales bacterium]|nr:VWA domain-containing protein [Bryobacterales bacterium]
MNGAPQISPNQVHFGRRRNSTAARPAVRSATLVGVVLGLLPLLLPVLWCFPLAATTVHIDNLAGSIAIKVSAAGKFDLIPTSSGRPLVDGDVRLGRKPGLIVIECAPEDNTPIDLELTIPYGVAVKARTTAGTIRLQGIVPAAELSTESGGLELISDWDAMKLYVSAEAAPRKFTLIDGLKLSRNPKAAEGEPAWELTDRHPDSRVAFGRVVAKTGRPDHIEIKAAPFPEDAPVRPHWQAPEVVDRLLSAPKKQARRAPQRPARERTGSQVGVSAAAEQGALFSSDVRIVDVPVSVFDSSGRPLAGLGKDDFEVIENGVPQAVAFLNAGESPFNLVLLLDLSGSTKQNRAAMKQAAQRFIEVAGPRDRVAAYALAQDMLHVVSPLTADHETLAKEIEALPEVSGGTPLYDAVALAYA